MKTNPLHTILLCAVAAVLLLGACIGPALASAAIYVDRGQLSTSLADTYVISSSGRGTIQADTAWVMTGAGLHTLIQTSDSSKPNPEPDHSTAVSGTITIPTTTVKIGLYYEDSAVASIKLRNQVGAGFSFGYYDSDRQFQTLSSTSVTSLVVQVNNGSSYGVTVTDTDGNPVYSYNGGADVPLGILPICDSGKAVTLLGSNPYYGGFSFYRYKGGNMHIINVLDIEDYVKGVIPYEMSSSWPIEALRAQACCARTYAMKNLNMRASLGFDLYATAFDQSYLGTKSATQTTDAAVDSTAGQYLSYDGELADACFFAADGGATESSENIWVTKVPYLTGVVDPYEADIDFYCKSWSKTFTTPEISARLADYSISDLSRIDVTRSATGNVIGMLLIDTDGSTYSFVKANCTAFLRALGFTYTSHNFDITHDGDTWTISGRGSGHNVGMSQWGAYSMAKVHGLNYLDILGFYYRGIILSRGVL